MASDQSLKVGRLSKLNSNTLDHNAATVLNCSVVHSSNKASEMRNAQRNALVTAITAENATKDKFPKGTSKIAIYLTENRKIQKEKIKYWENLKESIYVIVTFC